jgi:myo-inositol 2-dehydrogenase/D-chiro-inositol 1-dehydrogenase
MVILATPPGFRPLHYAAAVEAGKHVFMEKPVAVDAAGVRKCLEANKIAKEKDLAVAVGLQRRHEPRYKETIKRILDGMIGRRQRREDLRRRRQDDLQLWPRRWRRPSARAP